MKEDNRTIKLKEAARTGLGFEVDSNNNIGSQVFDIQDEDIVLFSPHFKWLLDQTDDITESIKKIAGDINLGLSTPNQYFNDLNFKIGVNPKQSNEKKQTTTLELTVVNVYPCRLNKTDKYLKKTEKSIHSKRYIHSGLIVKGYKIKVEGNITLKNFQKGGSLQAGIQALAKILEPTIKGRVNNINKQNEDTIKIYFEGIGGYSGPDIININPTNFIEEIQKLNSHFMKNLKSCGGQFTYNDADLRKCTATSKFEKDIQEIEEIIQEIEKKMSLSVISCKVKLKSNLTEIKSKLSYCTDTNEQELAKISADLYSLVNKIKNHGLPTLFQNDNDKFLLEVSTTKEKQYLSIAATKKELLEFNNQGTDYFQIENFTTSGQFILKTGDKYIAIKEDENFQKTIVLTDLEDNAAKFSFKLVNSDISKNEKCAYILVNNHQTIYLHNNELRIGNLNNAQRVIFCIVNEIYEEWLTKLETLKGDIHVQDFPLKVTQSSATKTLGNINELSNIHEKNIDKIINSIPNLKPAKDKSLVYIMGNLGAGKSTLTNCLIGHDNITFKKINGQEEISGIDDELPYAIVANSKGTSVTTIPAVYNKSIYAYCDTPGLGDDETDDINFFSLFITKELAKEIKAILIVIDYAEIVAVRGKPLEQIMRQLSQIFDLNEKDLHKNICFVINKKGQYKNINIDDILNVINELIESNNKKIIKIENENNSLLARMRQGLNNFWSRDDRRDDNIQEVERLGRTVKLLELMKKSKILLWKKSGYDTACISNIKQYFESLEESLNKDTLLVGLHHPAVSDFITSLSIWTQPESKELWEKHHEREMIFDKVDNVCLMHIDNFRNEFTSFFDGALEHINDKKIDLEKYKDLKIYQDVYVKERTIFSLRSFLETVVLGNNLESEVEGYKVEHFPPFESLILVTSFKDNNNNEIKQINMQTGNSKRSFSAKYKAPWFKSIDKTKVGTVEGKKMHSPDLTSNLDTDLNDIVAKYQTITNKLNFYKNIFASISTQWGDISNELIQCLTSIEDEKNELNKFHNKLMSNQLKKINDNEFKDKENRIDNILKLHELAIDKMKKLSIIQDEFFEKLSEKIEEVVLGEMDNKAGKEFDDLLDHSREEVDEIDDFLNVNKAGYSDLYRLLNLVSEAIIRYSSRKHYKTKETPFDGFFYNYRMNYGDNLDIINFDLNDYCSDAWKIYDVNGDGNCLYHAIVDQLKPLRHSFLNDPIVLSGELKPHQLLRLKVQGDNYIDGEWATTDDFHDLAKILDVIIAFTSFKIEENKRGFTCYYVNDDGEEITNVEDYNNLPDKPIVKIAMTIKENHFVSVRNHPMLTHGAYRETEEEEINFINDIDNSIDTLNDQKVIKICGNNRYQFFVRKNEKKLTIRVNPLNNITKGKVNRNLDDLKNKLIDNLERQGIKDYLSVRSGNELEIDAHSNIISSIFFSLKDNCTSDRMEVEDTKETDEFSCRIS